MSALSKTILLGIDAAVASLVEGYLEAGAMPNLAKLIERGAYTRAHSVFPGVTPINWATVSTGAYPGTHGITDFAVLDPGDALNGGRDGFIKASYRAETLWQAAAQAGHKVATLNFPGAEASQHENHLWFAGRGSPASPASYAIRQTSCLATQPYADSLRDSTLLDVLGRQALFRLDPTPAEGNGPPLRFEVDGSGVQVSDVANGDPLCDLRLNKPGPWLWADFEVEGKPKRGSYQLELVKFDPENNAFAVTVSQVTDPDDVTSDPKVGAALLAAIGPTIGPFIGYCGARGFDRGWSSARRMIDDGRHKGLWMARAARLLVEQHGYDLVMLKWHLIDHIQHAIWGGFDPISTWYDLFRAAEYEALMKASYAAADAMIGEVLPLLDQGVTIVAVSDHGHLPHLKAVSHNNLFVKHGLLKLQPGDSNPPVVDWSGTQVFGGPALGHIWINVQGRQPEGSVPPDKVDGVCQRVIDLLLDLRDPQNGERVVTKAVRREDAKSMGLWGDRTGDVVYWMSPGYSGDFNWSPLSRDGEVIYPLPGAHDQAAEYGEGKFIAHKFQSVHGCGDPAAALGRGTEEAILAMAGPQVRAGASLTDIPELVSVAPTISRATGLPVPSNSEGAVLEEWVG